MDLVEKSMLAIASSQPPRITTREQIEEVVNKLNPKKAGDKQTWKNKIIIEGGEEMKCSLKKIVNKIDKQREIPEEWEEMEIKATLS